MKALFGYLLFGLLAYTVLLLAKTPAEFVHHRYGEGLPVEVGAVTGQLWAGQAEAVTYRGLHWDRLNWRLSVWPLLTGRLALTVDLDGDLSGRIEAQARWDRTVDLANTRLHLPATALAAFAIPVDLTGDFYARIDTLRLDTQHPWPRDPAGLPIVAAQIVWQAAQLATPMALDLGQFALEVTTREAQIDGQLTSPEGPLQTQGHIRLAADGSVEWVFRLQPQGEAPAPLREALALLGRPDRGGAVTVRHSTTIGELFP